MSCSACGVVKILPEKGTCVRCRFEARRPQHLAAQSGRPDQSNVHEKNQFGRPSGRPDRSARADQSTSGQLRRAKCR